MPSVVVNRRTMAPVAALPAPPLTGLFAWYDADALLLSNGATVTTWTDISGNGRHLTPGGTGANVTYQSNQINGRGAVSIPDNRCMSFASGTFSGAGLTQTDVFIVFIPEKATAGSANENVLWNIDNNSGHTQYGDVNSQIAETFANNGTAKAIFTPTGTTFAWRIYGVQARTNYRRFWLDGAVQFPHDANSVLGFATAATIGGSGGTTTFKGKIAEIMFYSANQTADGLAQIHNYLSVKYGITLLDQPNKTGVSPNSIANLVEWYRADSLALNDGDAVAAWAPIIGATSLAQGTPASRPIYKVNVLNGQPVVRFASKTMSFAAALSVAGEFTLVTIGKYSGQSDFFGATSIWRLSTSANFIALIPGSGSNPTSNTYPFTGTNARMDIARRNAANAIRLFQNMYWTGESATTNAAVLSFSRLSGAVVPIAGDVAEFCYWNRNLSDSELTQLYHFYFNPRYALVTT